MGDKREVKRGEQPPKIVRKVVVTYRLEDDPKGQDHSFTLEHEGEGEIVDALVWGAPLMKKLGYLESDGRCTPVPTKPGKGWVLRTTSAKSAESAKSAKSAESAKSAKSAKSARSATSAALTASTALNCVWFHAHTCTWEEYCAPVV